MGRYAFLMHLGKLKIPPTIFFNIGNRGSLILRSYDCQGQEKYFYLYIYQTRNEWHELNEFGCFILVNRSIPQETTSAPTDEPGNPKCVHNS